MKSILVAVVLLASGVIAEAQQAKKVYRIGYLYTENRSDVSEAFRQGLRELGYVEGQNVVIQWQFAEGKLDRLPDLAAELVNSKADVIVSSGGPPTRAAKNATNAIPIVMIYISDPVALGFVSSLARPGGNITGISSVAVELGGKRLELLKEVVPKLSRVGVLVNKKVPGYGVQMKEVTLAAKVFGLELQEVEVRRRDDLQNAFMSIIKRRAGAVIGLSNPTFNALQKEIADLAVKNRLPTIGGLSNFVDAGGLMSYAANRLDIYRRAAVYVDKILKGAKPADLPVEQPMKFEFVVNLKTAKQIGITIPQWTLMKADRVIK